VIDGDDQMLSREVMLIKTLPEALIAAMDSSKCGTVCLSK
jgi:hypothetical protein